jgi:hypothetical protein
VPGSATGELHLISADALAERVAYFDAAAGERVAEVEKNILVQLVMITDDRRGAVEQARARFGVDYLGVDELLEEPPCWWGRCGFSYICVLEPSMAAMGTVIARLRRVSTGR